MSWKILLLVALAAVCTCTFYENNKDIQPLNFDNFNQVNRGGVWLVEFYKPWCPHCQHFATHYERIASVLSNIINVGAFDASQKQPPNLDILAVPTIRLFNEGQVLQYRGDRSEENVVEWVFQTLQKSALSDLKGQQKNNRKTINPPQGTKGRNNKNSDSNEKHLNGSNDKNEAKSNSDQ